MTWRFPPELGSTRSLPGDQPAAPARRQTELRRQEVTATSRQAGPWRGTVRKAQGGPGVPKGSASRVSRGRRRRRNTGCPSPRAVLGHGHGRRGHPGRPGARDAAPQRIRSSSDCKHWSGSQGTGPVSPPAMQPRGEGTAQNDPDTGSRAATGSRPPPSPQDRKHTSTPPPTAFPRRNAQGEEGEAARSPAARGGLAQGLEAAAGGAHVPQAPGQTPGWHPQRRVAPPATASPREHRDRDRQTHRGAWPEVRGPPGQPWRREPGPHSGRRAAQRLSARAGPRSGRKSPLLHEGEALTL